MPRDDGSRGLIRILSVCTQLEKKIISGSLKAQE